MCLYYTGVWESGSEDTQAEGFITGEIYIMIPGWTQSKKEEAAAPVGEAAGVTVARATTPMTGA